MADEICAYKTGTAGHQKVTYTHIRARFGQFLYLPLFKMQQISYSTLQNVRDSEFVYQAIDVPTETGKAMGLW